MSKAIAFFLRLRKQGDDAAALLTADNFSEVVAAPVPEPDAGGPVVVPALTVYFGDGDAACI